MGRRRGRGEGTIYQRADGRWCAQAVVGWNQLTGKAIRETLYADTYAEARDELKKMQERAKQGTPEARDMTVHGFLDFWLTAQKHKLADNTYLRYSLDLSYAKAHLDGAPLGKVTGFQVTRMYQSQEAAGLSSDARRKCGTRLRQAFGDAVRMGFLTRNPAQMVPLPRHVQAEMRALTPAEVQKFLAAAKGDRLEALYVVALDTGARMGELFALSREDWDETRSTLRFVRSLQERDGILKLKDMKTKSSRRTLDLGSTSQAALKGHRERMQAEGLLEGPLFCDTEGHWLRQGNVHRRSFKPLLKRAGLPPIRFHDLRHTTATLLLLAGENVLSVASRLGHSSPQLLLKTYGHILPETKQRAAQVLDRFLTPEGAGAVKVQ